MIGILIICSRISDVILSASIVITFSLPCKLIEAFNPLTAPTLKSEIGELIGRPKDYAASELKRTISEALLQDDRIEAVDNWSFEFGKKKVTATFTVTSIFGEFELRGDLTR